MTTAANAASLWLFAGRRAGQAMDPGSLRDLLQEIGVPAQSGRTATIRQLVLQMPPPVVAQALGYHRNSTTRIAAVLPDHPGADTLLATTADNNSRNTEPFPAAIKPATPRDRILTKSEEYRLLNQRSLPVDPVSYGATETCAEDFGHSVHSSSENDTFFAAVERAPSVAVGDRLTGHSAAVQGCQRSHDEH